MNQSDFAKLHGVSRKTVTSFRKTVTRPEKKAAGNKQGNKTGNRSSGNKSGNKNDKDLPESATKTVERMIAEHGVTMTLDEARQMKENFLALLTQLEYDIKSGQVLPYKDMIEAVGNEYARMRTRLIAIAPEHGPRLRVLASTTNDAEFVQALQEVVYEAMEELSLDADNNRGEN